MDEASHGQVTRVLQQRREQVQIGVRVDGFRWWIRENEVVRTRFVHAADEVVERLLRRPPVESGRSDQQRSTDLGRLPSGFAGKIVEADVVLTQELEQVLETDVRTPPTRSTSRRGAPRREGFSARERRP